MTELEKIQIENKILKNKLAIAEKWMRREIKWQVKKISKKKLSKLWDETKEAFKEENIEKEISKKINSFFWEYLLINTPWSVIDNIISWEINYYNLQQNPNFDWSWVIISYHKALDTMIESFIVKWFRKYAKKQWRVFIQKNDLLEKSLNSVINKWYILSAWRLFHIIKLIRNWDKMYDHTKFFKKYLDKYDYLKECLLSDDFFTVFEKLIGTETLWKKRHSWMITFVETRRARELLVWNFKKQKSLIYMLLKTQEVEI